jgi:aminoglycoside phosphotransferase (APT) family kinase protein
MIDSSDTKNTLINRLSEQGMFVFAVEMLGEGACNNVYRATSTEGRHVCIKVEKPDAKKPEMNPLWIEATIMQKLKNHTPDIKIPDVLLIDSEQKFYIYYFIEGKTLESVTQGNKSLSESVIQSLALTHAHIHMTPVELFSELPLQYTDDHMYINCVERTRLYATDLQLPSEWRRLLQWALEHYTDGDSMSCLIHNDAHNENIFVNDSIEFVALIDFGDVIIGDAHLDFINYVHEYPHSWIDIIDQYEQYSGVELSRQRILALAIIRFSKQLIIYYLSDIDSDRLHAVDKMNDYQDLAEKYI